VPALAAGSAAQAGALRRAAGHVVLPRAPPPRSRRPLSSQVCRDCARSAIRISRAPNVLPQHVYVGFEEVELVWLRRGRGLCDEEVCTMVAVEIARDQCGRRAQRNVEPALSCRRRGRGGSPGEPVSRRTMNPCVMSGAPARACCPGLHPACPISSAADRAAAPVARTGDVDTERGEAPHASKHARSRNACLPLARGGWRGY